MTDATSRTTTTTTTTTPEVEAFVQKIQTFRTGLTTTEQTMLDTIIATAQRTTATADVTAYTMTTAENWTNLATWLTTTTTTTTAHAPTTTTTTTTT
jgi:hypothetical protein